MTSRPSHSRRRFALVAALIAMGIAAPSTGAQATEPAEKPEPDLALILESSRAAENSELLPGLDHRTIALPADGLAVHVFAFDTSRFGLRTVQQYDETGSRALDFLAGPGDVFAINGGFFERDDDGRLSPSGLLVVDGVTVVMEHERAGSGVLHVGVGAASISYRADAPAPGALKSAVQVGPILVDPGGKVGIRSQESGTAGAPSACVTAQSLPWWPIATASACCVWPSFSPRRPAMAASAAISPSISMAGLRPRQSGAAIHARS